MSDENIDSVFAEMTAGLDLEVDAPAESDAPFALTGNGTVAVNIDSTVRLFIREAASELRAKLSGAEMTALPTPEVDGDPTDDFTVFAAQTLTDTRIERLGTLMGTISAKDSDAETAHVWISAGNDLRLDARASVEAAAAAGEVTGDTIRLAGLHDLAGAITQTLIEVLTH